MESTSRLLSGRVALVTGANRGIGKAITNRFIEEGAKVYAISRTKNSLAEFVDNELLISCYLDITDQDAVKQLFIRIKREENRLDILVNNAGIMQDALLGMITERQIQETFSVNVFSVINFIQYASKLMKKAKSGSIINVSSVMGIYGNSGQSVYSASKGAIIALTKSASKELSMYSIRVNAVAPGVIGTELIENISDAIMEKKIAQIGMGRIGSTVEVADTIVYLASDLSRYVSGQIIAVDGSMSL